MRKVMVLLVAMFLLASPVFADVFGTSSQDIFKVNQPVSLSKDSSCVDPDTIIGLVAQALSKLGSRAGYGYDTLRHEGVITSGATLYTTHNIAATLEMYNADGIGLGAFYNVGAVLPPQNTPVLKYLDYLYLGVSAGIRYETGKWRGAVVPEIQVKLTFN